MITKKFIENVRDAFDELNYHEENFPKREAFEQAAISTIAHCKELQDAKHAVKYFQFCNENWNKIEKMFKTKLDIFNEYPYEGSSLISLVPDEDAFGVFYVTNGIEKSFEDFQAFFHSDEEDSVFEIESNGGRFEFDDYFIKYAKLSSSKMKLFNSENECLSNIVLNDEMGIFLENNRTPYELVNYDTFTGIYDKKYIESLDDTDIIDSDKLLATIEWDILDEESEYGVAGLTRFSAETDLSMQILFAASTFLLYQKVLSSVKKKRRLAFLGYLSSQQK